MGARTSEHQRWGRARRRCFNGCTEMGVARDNTVVITEVKIVPHDLCSPLQWLWPSLLDVNTTPSDWLRPSQFSNNFPDLSSSYNFSSLEDAKSFPDNLHEPLHQLNDFISPYCLHNLPNQRFYSTFRALLFSLEGGRHQLSHLSS